MIDEVIVGVIAIPAGAAFVIFRDRFARHSVEVLNRAHHLNWGEPELALYRLVFVLVGVASIVSGVMLLLGLSHLRGSG